MIYASFGSISHGTTRSEDLMPTFADVLEYHIQRNADLWCSDDGRKERDRLLGLIVQADEIEDYNSETADDLMTDLFDALETFAPPYAYFGAHEGDGSDYGFWLSSDAIDHSFDGLRVDDTSKVPADYIGEVLHVNDHGNLTLYTADKGKLCEVWAIV